jgi:hypothetical protein
MWDNGESSRWPNDTLRCENNQRGGSPIKSNDTPKFNMAQKLHSDMAIPSLRIRGTLRFDISLMRLWPYFGAILLSLPSAILLDVDCHHDKEDPHTKRYKLKLRCSRYGELRRSWPSGSIKLLMLRSSRRPLSWWSCLYCEFYSIYCYQLVM